MLYSTLLQGKMFLVMIYFGILCGIALTAKKIGDRFTKNNKIFVTITDVAFWMLCSIVFIFVKITFCYGEFRLFELLAFSLGILLEQISLNNLVEKVLKVLYNLSCKIFCNLKKLKFFGKIFK